MRHENSPSQVVFLDESKILQLLHAAVPEGAPGATSARGVSALVFGDYVWTGNSAETATAGDSAERRFFVWHIVTATPGDDDFRGCLFMWCANEKRHTMFATGAWRRSLLATQRIAADATAREIED